MNEETASNDLPAKIHARAISRRITRKHNPNKPLTAKQLEIFQLYESGKTQTEICAILNKSGSYISDTLRDFAHRYKVNKEFIKLNGINILNSKVKEKQNNPSNKDIVDIVVSLSDLVEPKKGQDINLIDKQLNLSINDEAMNNLPLADKLERIRRVLSEGAGN